MVRHAHRRGSESSSTRRGTVVRTRSPGAQRAAAIPGWGEHGRLPGGSSIDANLGRTPGLTRRSKQGGVSEAGEMTVPMPQGEGGPGGMEAPGVNAPEGWRPRGREILEEGRPQGQCPRGREAPEGEGPRGREAPEIQRPWGQCRRGREARRKGHPPHQRPHPHPAPPGLRSLEGRQAGRLGRGPTVCGRCL